MAALQEVINKKNLKAAKDEMEIAVKVDEILKSGKSVKDGDWKGNEIEWLNHQYFLTAKPVVYLVNIGFDEYIKQKNKYLPKI